ncbi:MAG: HEAT repeat domain-containing protein [Candidatus Methanomethylicia archaeon]
MRIRGKLFFKISIIFVSVGLFLLNSLGQDKAVDVFVKEENLSDLDYIKGLDFKDKREVLKSIDKINDKNEKKKILRMFSDEKDNVVKEKAIIELSKTKDSDVMDELISNLKSTDTTKVIASLEGLINYSTYTKVQTAISGLLTHKVVNIRWKAVEVCGRAKIDRCVDGIVKLVNNQNEDEYVIRTALETLYNIKTKKAVDSLKNISVNNKNNDIKKMASNLLKLIEKERKK